MGTHICNSAAPMERWPVGLRPADLLLRSRQETLCQTRERPTPEVVYLGTSPSLLLSHTHNLKAAKMMKPFSAQMRSGHPCLKEGEVSSLLSRNALGDKITWQGAFAQRVARLVLESSGGKQYKPGELVSKGRRQRCLTWRAFGSISKGPWPNSSNRLREAIVSDSQSSM